MKTDTLLAGSIYSLTRTRHSGEYWKQFGQLQFTYGRGYHAATAIRGKNDLACLVYRLSPPRSFVVPLGGETIYQN